MANKIDVVVKKGDTLSQIANKYDTNVNRIMEINPNIKNPNLIVAGSTIKVETENVDLQPKPINNLGVNTTESSVDKSESKSVLGVNDVNPKYRDMSIDAELKAKNDAINQNNSPKTNKIDNKNIDVDIAMALYGSGLDDTHYSKEAASYLDKEAPIIIGNKAKEDAINNSKNNENNDIKYRDMSIDAELKAKNDAINQNNSPKTNKIDNKNIDVDIAMALYGSGLDGTHYSKEAASYLNKEAPIKIGNKVKEDVVAKEYKIPNMYKVHDNNKVASNKEIDITINANNIENKNDTKDIKTIALKGNSINKISTHQEVVERIKNEKDARIVKDRKFVAQANMEDYLQQQNYNKGNGSQSISLSDIELKKRNDLLFKSGILSEAGKISYQGSVHSKAQATANAKSSNGVLTKNNKTWQIGDSTSISAGTLSLNDYIYLVGQVAGESGNFTDDMLGVTTTILNRLETKHGGNNVKSVLAYGYWPFGKTYLKYVKVDKNGNLTFKGRNELSSGDYAKLEVVKGVVADAMNGTRNLNKNVIYYSGNGKYNKFSDNV